MRTLHERQIRRKLKKKGHQLINEIADMGFNVGWIYAELDRRLDRPGRWKQHFSKMNTDEELTRAINALQKMKKRLKRSAENKSAVYMENLDKIREIGRQNAVSVEAQRGIFYRVSQWLCTWWTLFTRK